MIGRRAMMALAGAAVAAPAQRVTMAQLYRQYLQVLAVMNDGSCDDERNDRLWERAAGLADRIIATPSHTLSEILIKLRLFEETEDPRAALAGQPQLLWPKILLSLIGDAERMSVAAP